MFDNLRANFKIIRAAHNLPELIRSHLWDDLIFIHDNSLGKLYLALPSDDLNKLGNIRYELFVYIMYSLAVIIGFERNPELASTLQKNLVNDCAAAISKYENSDGLRSFIMISTRWQEKLDKFPTYTLETLRTVLLERLELLANKKLDKDINLCAKDALVNFINKIIQDDTIAFVIGKEIVDMVKKM